MECVTKLEDVSSFIDIARNTDLDFGNMVSFIKVEEQTLPTSENAGEYNNERTRYCRACFSSSNLSSFEEKITLLQLFQEITMIDVGGNTKIWKKTSICSKCTKELEKVSHFKNLSISNSRFLERLATADTKRELLTTNGDGTSGNVVARNGLTDESTNKYRSPDIKEGIFEDGSDRSSKSSIEADENKEPCTRTRIESKLADYNQEDIEIEDGCIDMEEKIPRDGSDRNFDSNTETKVNEPLHSSIDIKEEIIDIDTESSINNRDPTETHIEIDQHSSKDTPMEFQQTEEKPFRCNYCGKGFFRKGNVELHLLYHCGKKTFKCDHCDKNFTVKFNFERHLLTHTRETPFKCEYCCKGFSRKSDLKNHWSTHTGEKPFKCDHCDRFFSLKANLKRHSQTHNARNAHNELRTREKVFECGQCGSSFTEQSQMQTHVLTHIGGKPFECICTRRFSKSHHLERHMLSHTIKKKVV